MNSKAVRRRTGAIQRLEAELAGLNGKASALSQQLTAGTLHCSDAEDIQAHYKKVMNEAMRLNAEINRIALKNFN